MLLIVICVLLLDGNNHLTGMCTSTTQKGFLSFSSGSVQVIKQLLLSLNLRCFFFFQLYMYEHLCCYLQNVNGGVIQKDFISLCTCGTGQKNKPGTNL